jgi:MFS family permease
MSQTTIPRAAVRGTAAGVIFMAFFGTLGIRAMQGWAFLVLIILSLLIGVILFIGAIVLIKKSSLLSNEVIKKDKEHWRKKNIWFGIIFSLEGLLIAITSFICTSTNHLDLFVPVMALIVGAHFFPLASLFQVPTYYITGTLLCLLATLVMLTFPVKTILKDHHIMVWWVSLGFGSALILWGTGVIVCFRGFRLISMAQNVADNGKWS